MTEDENGAPDAGRAPGWMLLLAGVGATLGGVVLLVWPAPTVLVFSQVAGWSMGLVGFLGALDEGGQGRIKTWAFAKAMGIGVLGVVLILWPGQTILVATVLAGAWLIVDGGSRVLGTISETSAKTEIVGNVLGVVEALFGILVVARPFGGARAAAVFAGIGLIVHGLGRVWDAVRGSASAAPVA